MKDAKPTMKNAIRAFCHDCMGHYVDPDRDCENIACPLYGFLRYAKWEPDLEWTRYNPARSGKVLFANCESRKANPKAIEALKKYRKGNQDEN